MRKLPHKTKIIVHLSTLIYFLICIMVGWFKESLIAFFIILFHEYAHTLTAKLFKYDVRDIHLYPFGAFVEIEDYGLHANFQDLLVALSGPATYFILLLIAHMARGLLGEHSYLYFLKMNQAVCFFNLLLIWPMDGSKILLTILTYVMDYLQALKLIIPISFLNLILLMHFFDTPNYFLVYGYLWTQIILYGRHFYYYYLRLLFFRRKDEKRKVKLHRDLSFFKPFQNYYFYKGRLIDEKEFINSKIFIDNEKSR